jgi:hypothetical protein
VQVVVEDIVLTYTKPKITKIVYQYIIVARDEFGHAEPFIVDVDKFNKQEFEKRVKEVYARRYRIPTDTVEVKWLLEPPKLEQK